MKNYYVWAGNKLLEFNTWDEVKRFKRGCLYKPHGVLNPWRFIRRHKWHASEKAKMPKEFILALLIAGVQT